MLCLELQDCPHTWTKEPVVFYHISALNITSVYSLTKTIGSIFKQNCLTSLQLPKVSVGQVRPEEPWREPGTRGETPCSPSHPAQPVKGHPLPTLVDTRVSHRAPAPPTGWHNTLCQVSEHLPDIPSSQELGLHEELGSCCSLFSLLASGGGWKMRTPPKEPVGK